MVGGDGIFGGFVFCQFSLADASGLYVATLAARHRHVQAVGRFVGLFFRVVARIFGFAIGRVGFFIRTFLIGVKFFAVVAVVFAVVAIDFRASAIVVVGFVVRIFVVRFGVGFVGLIASFV